MNSVKTQSRAEARDRGLAVPTRVTILVDNDVLPGRGLMEEHGFSALVERGADRILFDTGQGPALPHNAARLGVDLGGLTMAVLSHGHFDHSGGLLHVARLNPGLRVVAHPAVFSCHMVLRDGESEPKEISPPYTRGAVEALTAAFDFQPAFAMVAAGVWFTGFCPRIHQVKECGRLVTIHRGAIQRDPLEDDASLVMDTPSGTVLLLGCAHSGVGNVMDHVRASLGIDRIHGVIGGAHLGLSDPAETPVAVRAFEEAEVKLLAPCHCTGPGPKGLLKSRFPDSFQTAAVGAVFDF